MALHFNDRDLRSAIRAILNANADELTAATSAILNKVDKVSGKGLSTNDYTTLEKTKLAGLSNNGNTQQALTDAATIALDYSLGNVATVAIGATRNISITNIGAAPKFGVIEVTHTVAGSTISLPGNTAGAGWNTTAGGVTVLGYFWNGTNFNWSSSVSAASGPDVTAPIFVSAAVYDTLASRIVLTYGEAFAPSFVPATTDFTVSGGKTVTAVTLSGSKVFVDVNSVYLSTDAITFSYTKGTIPLQDAAGNQSVSLASTSATFTTSPALPINFTTVNAIANTSGTWNPTGGVSGYNHTGLASVKLPAGSDGWIGFDSTSVAHDAILGFKTTNALGGFATFGAGVFISAGPTIYKVDNGAAANIGVPYTLNGKVRIIRTGSVLKIQNSADGVTYSDVYTFAFTSTADLYIVCDISAPLVNPVSKGAI